MVIIVGMKLHCPKCSSERHWISRDGRFRCCECRKAFSDPRKRVGINHRTLRKAIQEFLLEHSTNTILSRVSISRYMLLKILTLVRMVMVQDVPAVFGQMRLAFSPGHPLNLYSVFRTFYPPHPIAKIHRNVPERHKIKLPFPKMIINWAHLAAYRAFRQSVLARHNLRHQRFRFADFRPPAFAINK